MKKIIIKISKSKKIIGVLLVSFYLLFVFRHGFLQLSEGNLDLPSFYWASISTFQHQLSPFDHQNLQSIGELNNFAEPIYPYLYTPPSLFLFYPFSFISYETAKIALLFLNHLVILFLLVFLPYKLIPSLRNRSVLLFTFFFLYVLNFRPLISTLNHGQINLFATLCLCLVWFGLKEKKSPVLIATFLSGAILLKLYPVIILLFLIIKKKYSAALWTVGLLLVITGLSVVILPSTLWHDWLVNVLPNGRYGTFIDGLFYHTAPWNQSINGLTSRLFLVNPYSPPLIISPLAAKIVPYIISILIVVFTFVFVKRNTDRSGDTFLSREFTLVLFSMFLIAPISWEHHFVLILPALAFCISLVWDDINFSTRDRSILGISIFVILLFFPFNSPHLKSGIMTLLISVKLFAVAALWYMLLSSLRFKVNSEPRDYYTPDKASFQRI